MAVWDITFFASDDITPLLGTVVGDTITQASFSTDLAHPRPYLIMPTQEVDGGGVDFVMGTAETAQLNIRLLDARRTPSDQTTGIITYYAADSSGNSQLGGHRCVVRCDGSYVIDGVVEDIKLMSDYVTYEISIRDIRERDRGGRLFDSAALRDPVTGIITQAPVVLASARECTFAGYGYQSASNSYVLSPAKPLTGIYVAADKRIRWPNGEYKKEKLKLHQVLVRPQIGAVAGRLISIRAPSTTYDPTLPFGFDLGESAVLCDKVSVLWRNAGGGGAWNEVPKNRAYKSGTTDEPALSLFITEEGAYQGTKIDGIKWVVLDPYYTAPLPADGATIEFMVVYTGTPSEDYPFYVDETVGQHIRNVCDGLYSAEPSALAKTRYNSTVMSNLATQTPRVRARIAAPVKDRREYLQNNWYMPWGIAPTLDTLGRLAPTIYALPIAGTALKTLDNTNTNEDGSWSHSGSNAITEIDVTLIQEIVTSGFSNNGTVRAGDGIIEETTQRMFRDLTAGNWGERKIEIAPVNLRDLTVIDSPFGLFEQPGEAASFIMQRVTELFHRYRYGTQKYSFRCKRSDAANVEAARAGDWVLLGHSWLPDNAQRLRGLNRIGQITRAVNIDPIWKRIEVEDAGGVLAPTSIPSGYVSTTPDTEGAIVVVLVVGGDKCVLQWAASVAAPANDSGLWRTFATVSAPGTYKSQPLAPGDYWFRAYSTSPGKFHSAYVDFGHWVVVPVATLRSLRMEHQPDGSLDVIWEPGRYCGSVRIAYESHYSGVDPTYPAYGDTYGALGVLTFNPADFNTGKDTFSVKVTPYIGPLVGGAVSGAAGRPLTRSLMLSDNTDIGVNPILDQDALDVYLFPNRTPSAASIKYATSTSGPVTLAATRAGTSTTSSQILIGTFVNPGDTIWVGVLPYDTLGGEGVFWQGSITYIAGRDDPIVTWLPAVPSVDTDEAIRLIVVDNGDQVALYFRNYDAGTTPPAYSRDPASGYVSDPLIHTVQVTKPAEGGPPRVIEFYAIDDGGNQSKPEQVRVDADADPSGNFVVNVDERSGEIYVTPQTMDSDSGSWRFRVKIVAVGDATYDAVGFNDADATEYKGNTFGVPLLLAQKLRLGDQVNINGYYFRTTSTTAATQNTSKRSVLIKTNRQRTALVSDPLALEGWIAVAQDTAPAPVSTVYSYLELTLPFIGVSLDRYDVWLRRSAQPTIEGTATQGSRPDDAYKVADGRTSLLRTWRTVITQDGTYYAAVRGISRMGVPGPIFYCSTVVSGGVSTSYSPINPYAFILTRDASIIPQPVGVIEAVSPGTHRIRWTTSLSTASYWIDLTWSLNGSKEAIAATGIGLHANGPLSDGTYYYDYVFPAGAPGAGGLAYGNVVYTLYLKNSPSGSLAFRVQGEVRDAVVAIPGLIV